MHRLLATILFPALLLPSPARAQQKDDLALQRAQHLRHGINTSDWFAQSGDYSVQRLRTFTTADILSGQTGQVVYDIDGEGATAADVAAIHAAGAIAVCYVDVGTLETGRPDYSSFPTSVVGAVHGLRTSAPIESAASGDCSS